MFRTLTSLVRTLSRNTPSPRSSVQTKRRFQPALEALEAREQPSATLVRDINGGAPSSSPTELTSFRGTLFFVADNGFQGRELWMRTRQGNVVLVRDINPGAASSDPQNLTVVRPRSRPNSPSFLYFSADNGQNGRELWRTNGTAAGTFMVRDINPGAAGSDPGELISFRRREKGTAQLIFAANNGINGRELWRSDGSNPGTQMVRDINPGPGDSSPTYLTFRVNSRQHPNNPERQLLFRADDGALGAELWRSEGRFASTQLVEDIRPGPDGSNPFNLTRVGRRVFFGADDGFRGAELWRSNGTRRGTDILRDINPGPDSSLTESATALMAAFQRQLFFAANDGVLGTELWRSDGTLNNPGRTRLVRDINPGANSSNPSMQAHPLQERRYLILNNELFFAADNGFLGGELWKTNGSGNNAGTQLVRDINPGPGSSLNNELIGIVFQRRDPDDSRIYFAANSGINIFGNELWRSDGTFNGTQLEADINSGTNSSDPASFEITPESVSASDRDLFFAADNGLFGRELWQLA